MVKNLATGATTEAVVTDEGYQVRSIPPGTYEAEVAAKGFKKSVAGDLVVQLGETARYSVKLDIGVVTESIEVQANLALLQPDQTQQTNIINNVQVESLPNVSRNFVGSVYTLPGVVNSYAPTLQWSARLELCQWRRETLDKESIWPEGRSTSLSRW